MCPDQHLRRVASSGRCITAGRGHGGSTRSRTLPVSPSDHGREPVGARLALPTVLDAPAQAHIAIALAWPRGAWPREDGLARPPSRLIDRATPAGSARSSQAL